MKTYEVSYGAIADVTVKVKAETFADAIDRVLNGEGELIECEYNEMLDGTNFVVSRNGIERTYDEDGNLESEYEKDDE